MKISMTHVKLQVRVAIFTGTSCGIGRGAAKLFAKEEAEAVIGYNRSGKEAKSLADEIRH